MQQQHRDLDVRWVEHQRRRHKTTQSWTCIICPDRKTFHSKDDPWEHAQQQHQDELAQDSNELRDFRVQFAVDSAAKRAPKDDCQSQKPVFPEPPPAQITKRPFSSAPPPPPSWCHSGLRALNLGTPRESKDTTMQDPEDDSHGDQPRKRVAVGEGISAGSASPMRKSESPPPRRSKGRRTTLPHESGSESLQEDSSDRRPPVAIRQLWSPDQDSPLRRSSFDPSNIASVQAQRSRAQALKARRPFQASPSSKSTTSAGTALPKTPSIPPKSDDYDIILQPETRPISQEQLVAEVKGIYAGLVMVEAKCIEVDNKQTTLTQPGGTQSKLNNEQWQALIALHRTLLHEHHDFFLASQHPSASPALRRLASKYAMPARMWRHGIHSFLELLRHRLPASLDHMLAFIYLAYTMMALLYETVPAFEDTWVECLGDLARYRMAIEDDDIRDREVWTGVARHWYSKASDKSPTTGRLYHHLAILARPNALQQLFYYAKSLCVAVPFTSARESILTLFEPVLNAENGQGQYRLPPLDTAFVKAHGLLFTARSTEKLKPTVEEFMRLLDGQIGRVTRKFMEQGHHIAVAHSIAMLGCASKDNVLMKAIFSDGSSAGTIPMGGSSMESILMSSFPNARRLNNATLEIVFQRIRDPNVLPYIHVTLVFMHLFRNHPSAMELPDAEFPWKQLTVMLNNLLAPYQICDRIERDMFPLPEKDDCPFPKDYAMRCLIWTDKYFPEIWFKKEKIDEEEKYLEAASMTTIRKERVLWLAHRIASIPRWMGSVASKMLKNKTLRSMALAAQILKAFPVTLASAIDETNSTVNGTQSHPESDSKGPSQYFEHIWYQLRDQHSGTIIENTAVAVVLSGSYLVITFFNKGPKSQTPLLPVSTARSSREWDRTDLLPIATGFISIYSLYLGNGELESGWQLAMLATHNISLSIKFLRQKLSEFPKSMKPVEFLMESTSLISAGILTKCFPVHDGRYKNSLVQAAMFLPLTNLFVTVFYIRIVRHFGIAQALEDGSLSASIRQFWQKRSYAIIAMVLILLWLAKS